MTRPTCNGEPPPDLRDPVVRRLPLDRFKWEHAVRGKIKDGEVVRSGAIDPRYVAVALMLSTFANSDGTRAHPGDVWLANATGRTDRHVREALAWLEEHGFLLCHLRAGRPGVPRRYASEYALAIPAPLADELGLWEDGSRWMERPEDMPNLHQKAHDRTTTGTSVPPVAVVSTGTTVPAIATDHRNGSTRPPERIDTTTGTDRHDHRNERSAHQASTTKQVPPKQEHHPMSSDIDAREIASLDVTPAVARVCEVDQRVVA